MCARAGFSLASLIRVRMAVSRFTDRPEPPVGLADINVAARQGVISSSTGARAVRKAPQRHWVAVRRVEEVMVEPRMASSLSR